MIARKNKRAQSAVILILFWVLISSAHAETAHAGEKTVRFAASIFPLADIAGQIAGEQVTTILLAGANPHSFELTPQAVRSLQNVRTVFVIGHGLDDWVRKITESLPEVKLVPVDQKIELMKQGRVIDPHYWLSIENAKQIARNIAQVLIESDPLRQSRYEENLNRYLDELDQADREIKNLLSDLPERKILTFHDGWRYFAKAYGFEIAGTVEPSEGGEPRPRHLADIAEVVRSNRIRALFSEVLAPRQTAESLAQDLNLHIYELDPTGGTGGRNSYIGLMLANARTIQEAFLHESE